MSSCEFSWDFDQSPLTSDERSKSRQLFYDIIVHFETKHGDNDRKTYNRPSLVKLTYEYSLSEISKDAFLRLFLDTMHLSLDGDADTTPDLDDPAVESVLEERLTSLADYLMDNFFMPLVSTGGKTPFVAPLTNRDKRFLSYAKKTEEPPVDEEAARLVKLRADCVARDGHRCIVSRGFDMNEAENRYETDGDLAADDDGAIFEANDDRFELLRVAHIIPHALGQPRNNKHDALRILDLLDYGVSQLVEGDNIDLPYNTVTMNVNMITFFSRFDIFFTPVQGQEENHTYDIHAFLPPLLARDFPVRRTLGVPTTLSGPTTIDPPSARLLAVHRAIAHILELSGAGGYIGQVFRDLEERAVRADGTTPLGSLVALGLGGYLPGRT